ncbi:MobF family relaxase [Nocardia nova]|uniref:MobF family relaxase n=1 Tax=Nocardia nova TaxID=37330 RepID=UPI0018935B02|nr:MobF family relaxase [Nocardia nova]MBF6278079.1 relaxase domain-containing protein [Nocardia nova]
MMSLAKIASGDGYEYYLRNIATHDANERGAQALADYYSERGESPGRWMGSGLPALGIAVGDEVTEAQMRALIGRGMHPNADAIIAELAAEQIRDGVSPRVARLYGAKMARLGQPFNKYAGAEAGYRYECGRAYAAWNAERGHVEYAPIPEEVRQQIRTDVALSMFGEEYGRPPADDRELSGWIARASRPNTKSVAGFDLTFSPVKSVSALWALAPREIAEKIEAAHHAAIGEALDYLEKHAAYTRVGRHSVRQVDVEGLIATGFTHRDSRAGDPDLHTHVVIANKVRRISDGQWGSLDGRMIYRHNVPASELYNTRLEHHLEQALGVRFVDTDSVDMHKRRIREIDGMPEELMRAWSTRAEAITTRLTQLSAEFQSKHHRQPTPKELLKLGEEATLSTRGGKHAARSRDEQRRDWRAQAAGILGGEQVVDTTVAAVMGRQAEIRQTVTDQWASETAASVVATVSVQRATWQEHHLRAETHRQLRGLIDPAQWQAGVDAVMAAALAPPVSIPRGDHNTAAPIPALARADGTSVYVTAGSTLYTSPEIVAAEQRLINIAGLERGATIPISTIETAEIEFAANHGGRGLNSGQAEMVAAFATSGKTFQVAVAPAGTGKTTAMRVLVDAWMSQGGKVLGLAPTGAAAAQLRDDTGVPTATVDMLATHIDRYLDGTDIGDIPEWAAAIGPTTLVVIDEIAKTGTLSLDKAIVWLAEHGATIRAIGDDHQLSSVAAGGVIRDIIDIVGATELTQVLRFADSAESAASLALREGDPAAIGYYIDHARVQVGVLGDVAERAYRAWAADTATGLDSVLLAPTRDMVRALNARARTDRIAATGGRTEPEAVLSDGLSASAGDVITTRRNNYRLRISSTDHVRNGYRWTVRQVHPDGRITAAHIGSGRLVTLPADYVAAHTTLGYAGTIDSSQGLTVDTSHTVLTGREHRAQLYVAMTRARAGAYAYLGTAGAGDEHSGYTYTAVHPPTAVDLLTDILGRDGTQTSAATAARDAADPRRQLAGVVDSYLDALGAVTEHHLGPNRIAQITTAAERIAPGVTDADAWPVLRQHLALIAVSGRDPIDELATAAAVRELGTADDIAAVLDWRLDPTSHQPDPAGGPLAWIPAVPDALAALPEAAHLRDVYNTIHQAAADIRSTAAGWDAESAPRWAQPLLAADRDLIADLAVWRAAQHVPDHDRRPTGPDRYPAAERRSQQDLSRAVAAAVGDLDGPARRWATLAGELDDRLPRDPYWPVLAEHLDTADRGGLDVDQALRTAMARPLPDEQPAAALRWRLTEQLDDHRPVDDADQTEPEPEHSSGSGTDDLLTAAGLLDWTGELTAAPDAADLDLPDTGFPGVDPGYDLGL